ncbi:MAG TPA: permease [Bacteroidales bacterium]|nr:permease [Bacteroidales bacterium]
MNLKKNPWLPLILLPVWYIIYHYLQPLTEWLVYSAAGLQKGKPLTEAVWFFIYEVPKVLLLLTLIIFFVGIIRTFFTPERTRKALEGKGTLGGNIMAAGLGIVTPFCSCSAIPLFIGFVESGVPLGVTFSFLIASPMINEVAIVLLYGMFGTKIMLIYITTGLVIAILAGWTIGKLKLEKWVEPWIYAMSTGKNDAGEEKIAFGDRVAMGYDAVGEILKKVWIYIMLGIGVGAFAHGYIPEDFMVKLMGKSVWYSVPLSVLIGIPLYTNAAGIVPIISVLLEKGAALGTALAFMMAVIGLSLPEMIILRKVLKLPLIFTFAGIIGMGIIIVGYIFNFIF